MTLSPIGKRRFQVYGKTFCVLLLVNTIILGLSGHINQFQKFYYHADVIPFALSLSTMVFLLLIGFLEINLENPITAKPPFELGWLALSSLLWLAFNSFSTSRWRFVNNGLCKTIPDEPLYGSYKTWCNEVQALRAFIWVEWVIFFAMFIYIFQWAFNQHRAGRRDVWTTVISRFYDIIPTTAEADLSRSPSEFLQWEKFNTTVDNSVSLAQAYHEPAVNYRVHTQIQPAYHAEYPSMQFMSQEYSKPGPRLPKIHRYYNEQQEQRDISENSQHSRAI